MRRTMILLSLLMVLLAACAPAIPTGSDSAQEENVDNPVSQPTADAEQPATGETLKDVMDQEQAAPASDAPIPELTWDTSPDNVLLSATFCCGFVPRLVVTNYIPDATIWGDGRIVWTIVDDSGGRQVLEGQLSMDDLDGLLTQFAEAGFFGWENRYGDITVADLADQCIQINLASGPKAVCEYGNGAPQAFHDLYSVLNNGVGVTGEAFIPETGYLTVETLGADFEASGRTVNEWGETGLKLDALETDEGVWVEGAALELAWQTVNGNSSFPLIQADQSFYQIGLQIPGLSWSPPPSP